MTTPVLSPSSFVTGEVAPTLFGNVELARMHSAAATMRNFWPRYSGGAYSRAGTAFAGFSKQTGRNYPPRLIPFQFSINQGLMLEFGNYYMRVVFDGGYVTESPFTITGISRTNPAVVNYQSLSSVSSVTANTAAVTSSYVRGDTITPAGGTVVTPAVFIIDSTLLASVALGSGGIGYAVGDTITLAGGTTELAPVLTVTGISGGAITTFAISNPGRFILNGTGNFTQASTSGAGSGATFTGGLFGPNELTVQTPGGYTAVPANPANQASTSGAGLGATYTINWATPAALANGDWVFIQGVNGMLPINNQTYVITNLTANSFALTDVFGNTIDASGFAAWTSGGTASRIYTLTTQYSEVDLEWIKWTQSADTMSLCCVNQESGVEYQPQDLARVTDTDWTFSNVVANPSVAAPTNLAVSASTTGSIDYAYQVTAVSPVDGSESVASATGAVTGAVNIAATAGSITVSWTGVAGVSEYNIYKATPVDGSPVPVGSLFGYAGTTYGTQFVDSNIVADFTQVPPTHQNPFARGQILSVKITAPGTGGSFTYSISSLTGSGAVLETVAVSNALAAVIVIDPGSNYQVGDTITFNNGATGTLVIGPQSGTYPGVVTYFQQRRAYAYTLNQPDTYFMSQPGAFKNFDTRIPTIDTDAITGTPWSQQVNGIQFMVPITGGLIAMTGIEAYLVGGAGTSVFSPQPITPASQQAQPEGFNGCSPTIPPIRIYQDIIYVQSKGSTYRDFAFEMSNYTFTGKDLTLNSTHLFNRYTIREHAWCEEPYKILWAVRDDGILISLTYMKTEQVAGWARHDTNGIFYSVASITEPPVDALYVAVQRQFPEGMAYTVERMDNRLWTSAENSWCVDCGFALAQPAPNANLSASSATGLGAVTGVTNLVGGSNYSPATTASVVDAPTTPYGPAGPGTGAVATPTIVGGVITAVAFVGGTGYLNPQIQFNDPAGSAGGSGASATCVLDNSATFTASANVFSAGDIGSVIRMGGGKATITAYVNPTEVIANITDPIAAVQANSGGAVQMQAAGTWTMTAPVTTVYGLRALAGMKVTGLADGTVIPPFTVPADGVITLASPASAVTIGLGFQAQLQSVYLDAGSPTVQGQRGKIAGVNVRVEASGDFLGGSNQPDGSTLSPPQIAPTWSNLAAFAVPTVAPFNSTTRPLYTGDIRVPVQGGFQKPKQVAIQQDNPLPVQVLAFIPDLLEGDNPAQAAPKHSRGP